MSHKSEIKVYLPQTMIGELERKKSAGLRSRFIQQAIREELDRREKATLMDWEPYVLISNAIHRLDDRNQTEDIYLDLLQLVLDNLMLDVLKPVVK